MEFKKLWLVVSAVICSLGLSAQHLTISNSGETGTSGTNWSIINNVLYIGSSGSASINTSVISNHLSNTGDLTINLPWQSGVARHTYINNTIAYSGSNARTLTIQSANDIIFANATGITSSTASLNVVLRSALGLSLGAPDYGLVKLDGINIDTKGGHLWVGGGTTNTTWNGLTVGNSYAVTWSDDVAGVSLIGSSVATNGGNIYMSGHSWDSFDGDGVNYAINVQNSNISSGAGAIYFLADLNGRYTNGIGLYVHGTTSITSTTGSIYVRGYGTDQSTNGNSWRVGASILGSAQIKSVSGAITVVGDANFTATVNDKEGLLIGDGAAICSQTGNITLRGTNTLESSGQFSNSIRFAAANVANSIRIGFDGTNAYSGNIVIEGNSIYQRYTHLGAGSIAVRTTGTLTIQPTGNSFTYMRAANEDGLTYDDDWNFGTTLSGFTFGKSTNTTNLAFANFLTTAGPITMYGGQITLKSNLTTTANTGHISLLAKTHITNANATTITTQGGDVLFASNVDDATDGESTTNGYIQLRQGITVNTNGGDITFGGGNTSGSDYALGSSDIAFTEGIRFDVIISLNSGGGNIALRGKSYAMGVYTDWGASGVGFYFFSAAVGTINSGTGTITIDGYSQTHTSSFAAGFYCMHNLTISSANTTANAISITGKATGASGEAWGIESENTLSVLATGTGGGITINTSKQLTDNFDAVFRGETNILALSGPINIKTGQLSGTTNGYFYLNGHMYLGSKAGSAVTSSSSNINIQVDRYYYDNFALPKLATSGSVTIQPNATSFGAYIYTSYFNLNQNSQTMSGFTFGKPGNTGNLYLNTAFTVAGPINVYGGYVQVSGAVTSSGNFDILLKGITNSGSCVNVSGTITKPSGTGTLLMQGHGRVITSGTISGTGTGVLNLIMWSDYDGDNVGGGSTLNGGSVSTNGGHVWLGGSNSNGGSYTWNGLTVGDGPSIGTNISNCHAIDLFAPITTAGGDILLWAGNGVCGTSGIQSDGTRHLNAGSGDITLIAYQTGGGIDLTSTGVISLVPHAGSYASALTLGGTLTSGNFTFNTSHYNGLKINSLANSGLVIGNYTGHFSGSAAVTQGNSSNVTVSSALSTKSLEIHGGAIALNENITTSGTGSDVLIKGTSNINLAASKTITTAGGDVNLWADSDDNSTGYVQLLSNAVINSNGGDINLGGGSSLATDYAYGTTSESCPEVLPASQYISGVHFRQSSSLNSNGGNISVRGQNANTSASVMSFGISLRGVTMNSGTGKIALNGLATGSGSVNAQAVASWGTLTLRSANTSADAISITGDALSSVGGSSLGVNAVALFEATGVGGGITITGKSGVASVNAGVNIGGDILAASGPITISGENISGVVDNIMIGSATTIGKKSGTNVTTSSSNVVLEGNSINVPGSVFVDCSGTLTIQPFGDSFASALTWPMTNVTHAALSGLTIGKLTNTSNVTLSSATSVNGPLSIFAGPLAVTGNLATTNTSTGDMLLKASTFTTSGNIAVADGKELTLNFSSTNTYAGTITGTGIQLVKKGVGQLNLSADLTIGGSTTVDAGVLKINNGSLASVSVSNGANLTLAADKDLTISGALVNNGTFKLESGASLLQTSVIANSGNGTYIAERYITGAGGSTPSGRFWYMGVPMSGATSAGASAALEGNRLWSHSEVTGAYAEITDDVTTLNQTRGYVFRGGSNGTYAFSSDNIGNGDVSYTLTRTGSAPKPGFNLISNPYPSHVSWDQLWNSLPDETQSSVLPTVWYRTATSGNVMLFDTYNATIGVGTNNSGTSLNGSQVTGTIAPFQSFWVRVAPGTASVSLTATNAMRSHGNQTFLTLTPATVRLNISNGAMKDETIVVLNEDLSNDYDYRDSGKEIPSATLHQLYSLEGSNKVAINGIANALEKDTLQLGVQIPTAGTYSINCTEFTFSDLVFLEDKITDAYLQLDNTTAYSFTSEAGTFNNRFVLHFVENIPALPGQTAATAIPMSTSNWPQCNNVTSSDSWHAFTAGTEGVSIAVNTTTTDVVIELQDINGNILAQENAVSGIGNETLNFFGLTAGQTYKVGVRNNINNQPVGTYGICVKTLKRGGCDYGAGPYSLCQYYKATWAGSTGVSYTFTFTGTSGPAQGQVFTRTQNSDICVLSTVTPLLPYGSTYDVTISNTYTLTDGAGNTEQITVPSNAGCQVITMVQPQTALSANSSCNNGPRFRGAVVSSMPWVCGASNWRWRFTEVNPLTLQSVGLPIELNRGAASNYLNLGTVNQLQNGKTYAVQTAPLFTYTGLNYQWGATQYMCIVGVAQGMLQDAQQGVAQGQNKDAVQDASQVEAMVFVTEGNHVNIQLINTESNTAKRADIFDVTGKLVKTVRLVEGMNLVDFENASGIFMVRVTVADKIETKRVFVGK